MKWSAGHLTYCTNIHPAQTLSQVVEAVAQHTVAVKALVCDAAPMGVGLRLSAEAARALVVPQALDSFKQLLATENLYVFTLNGFPYGAFHGAPVKEQVYQPDWRSQERLEYTQNLARILAALLPTGQRGSISTVPGAYKTGARRANDRDKIIRNLIAHVADLVRMERETGARITLALEPEPCCLLETTDETLHFFNDHLLSERMLAKFCDLARCSKAQSERLLRRHLGVCLDACHAAIEFESPVEAYDQYRAAGIEVAKVQITAGLELNPQQPAELAALSRYDEPVYLHQVIERNGETLKRYTDLGDAFKAASKCQTGDPNSLWRVHFHVPVHTVEYDSFRSTQRELLPLLARLSSSEGDEHVEVETYTWDVLPEQHRSLPLAQSIAAEIDWTLRALRGQQVDPAR